MRRGGTTKSVGSIRCDVDDPVHFPLTCTSQNFDGLQMRVHGFRVHTRLAVHMAAFIFFAAGYSGVASARGERSCTVESSRRRGKSTRWMRHVPPALA